MSVVSFKKRYPYSLWLEKANKMSTCSVKWCGNNSRTSNFKKDGITFHRFPRCPERKKIWIDATSRGEEWFPTNNSVICSRHFTEDNFHIMKNRRRLMDSAVPSLYLPVLAPDPLTIETSAGSSVKKTVTPVAGTSFEKSVSVSLLKDTKIPPISDNQSNVSVTPKKQSRKVSPIPATPSAYNNPIKKRLCRRIIELTNVMKIKDKKIKKLSDSNRRLKRKVVSLKSLLSELEKKGFITAENNEVLKSLGVKCTKIIRRQIIKGKSGTIVRKKYSPQLKEF